MGLPYQCIKRCGKVLVAAKGSFIDTFNPEDGSLLSTWKCPSAHESSNSRPETSGQVLDGPVNRLGTHKSESPLDVVLESSPPAKRRKLSAGDEDGPAQNPAKENGRKKDQERGKKGNRRLDAVAIGFEAPAVISLAATEDGRHVIAVTGEDKSIRVFQNSFDGDGRHYLSQLSQRAMPKRPCAIAVTSDDSTIISADKFGDVYSLPLLIPATTNHKVLEPATPTLESTSSKLFVPAANNLTVHSQRNRKALENQKKQTPKQSEKSEPSFEHKLLLGHVSMLTDLALVTLECRDYILTADRDEHIRVSRGIPQAHIIESFCLGHEEFISRLCVPGGRKEILISGGGEGEIFVWDWLRGVLLHKADLRALVVGVMSESDGEGVGNGSAEAGKIAVSEIIHVRQAAHGGDEDLLIVTCEGVPAAFTFLLNARNELQHNHTLKVPGNVLGLTTDTTDGVVLSIDTIHKPGTMTQQREEAEILNPLQKFKFQGKDLVPSTVSFEVAKSDYGMKDSARLGNLFYSLENLRKWDDEKEEE